MQYHSKLIDLGRYAPHIMVDERMKTWQFIRGLRPELRDVVVATYVTNMKVAYQAIVDLEEDKSRTQSRLGLGKYR